MDLSRNRSWIRFLIGSLFLLAACSVRGDQVFGDFEGSLDDWTVAWGGTDDLGNSTNGATLNSQSMTVLVGSADFWKLQRIGVLTLVGASRITMDITFIAAEWPGDTWININKIALMDHTAWAWQEVDRDMMIVTKISGADPPGDDGSGNIAWWGPWMGDTTWTISWRLENIAKTNDTYDLYMALQCSKDKGEGGYFYIDNVKVVTEDLAQPPSRLHADGNKIKNEENEVVTLRGVSLIDLGFLQDWQGGATNMVDRLTDPTDLSCDSIGWQTNVIRIPIFPPHLVAGWPYPFDPGDNDDLYDLLRVVVDYCGSKGIYAIIDWHDINNTYDTVAQAVEFWDYMAPRFADDTHVLFELFSKPINDVGTDTEDWLTVKADMETLIDTVRAHAPDTLLLIGTPSNCKIVGPVVDDPVDDTNVAYITHLYPYHWIEENLYYTTTITVAATVHPVILGEWGFLEGADDPLNGTITNYGEPLRQFVEGLGIGSIAWVSSYDWQPPMYDTEFDLLEGEGYMGCFVKDWIYGGWESEQDLNITMTINRCQVTAGRIPGQDTLEMSGTFTSSPPNLLAVPHVGVNITSLADDGLIYSEDCDYTWDIAGNRFIWSERYVRGEPGRVTLLLINFARRTLIMRAENVDLTGLGCPMRFDIELGSYLLSGQVDENVVNGTGQIPIRLMNGYADEIRVSRARARDSIRPAGDFFQVRGEITLANLATDLTSEELVLTWGAQTFTVPAGSFRVNTRGNLFWCANIPAAEGGRVSIRIDTSRYAFTATLRRADLDVASGTVEFGMSFAAFDQSVNVTLP